MWLSSMDFANLSMWSSLPPRANRNMWASPFAFANLSKWPSSSTDRCFLVSARNIKMEAIEHKLFSLNIHIIPVTYVAFCCIFVLIYLLLSPASLPVASSPLTQGSTLEKVVRQMIKMKLRRRCCLCMLHKWVKPTVLDVDECFSRLLFLSSFWLLFLGWYE